MAIFLPEGSSDQILQILKKIFPKFQVKKECNRYDITLWKLNTIKYENLL